MRNIDTGESLVPGEESGHDVESQQDRTLTEEERKRLMEAIIEHYKSLPDIHVRERKPQYYDLDIGRALLWVFLAMGNELATPNQMMRWLEQQRDQHDVHGHEDKKQFFVHLLEILSDCEFHFEDLQSTRWYSKKYLPELLPHPVSLLRTMKCRVSQRLDCPLVLRLRMGRDEWREQATVLTDTEQQLVRIIAEKQPPVIQAAILALLEATVAGSFVPESHEVFTAMKKQFLSPFWEILSNRLKGVGISVTARDREFRLARMRKKQ